MFGISSFTGSGSSMTSFFSRATNSVMSSLGAPGLSSLGLSFTNIYNLLKGSKDREETELKELTLQTSTYNKVIPEVFGSIRIAGTIIWASDIKKTSVYHPSKMTKYGSQSAYTEYFVRGSFAIAVCKGVVDEIKNIYANNEPLILSTYNIRVYYGDENQTQDPTMQSYLGVNTPAFRGICYVVFHDFPMEEFGGVIPNFTFDVVRKKELQNDNDMEQMVKSINIIPGSGEFVYDTITQKKLNGEYITGTFVETSKATILNNHTYSSNTDAVDSLNDLQNTFPNLEWVSLVVCWFCDNLNCGEASIYPACENKTSITKPDEWKVAGKTRATAKVVGLDEEGNIRYGGTPSDDCVKRYAKEIKRRGLKLCIYPMLMMDVEQKPWRGRISGNAEDVANFFTKTDGYNNFIKHYVNLLKDDIDAVIIGSEMIGLTSVFNENSKKYPAVEEFCNLANEVRSLVKSGTKITYTADWSEYHHDERSNYNLDKLWANENIDFIGIDAYFPLTDKDKTTYDIEEIKNGWRSGEGYDFYYANSERTIKQNLGAEWAWKNVEWFWANKHYNQDGTQTEWVPKSKKIWFMEYGFPSVDCCTNQPNVFYSKGSLESSFPRNSTGSLDFKAQRVAIKATELAWENSECVENKFLYTWDARPYPYFPNLKNVWADADCWKYGHFLNGKSGTSTLACAVDYLCRQVLNEEDYDVSLLNDTIIDGYVVDDKKSILSHLKTLAIAFNFDAYVDGGKIIFKPLADAENHIVSENDLLMDDENKKISFYTESIGEHNIPSGVEMLFMDIANDYKFSTAVAKNNCIKNDVYGTSIKVPMGLSQAQEVAWHVLSCLANQKTGYVFYLPISFANISPLDTITISFEGEEHVILVKSIELIDLVKVKIVGVETEMNRNVLSNLEYSNDMLKMENIQKTNNEINYVATTNFELFELYNIKNDTAKETLTLHCAIWSDDKNWEGATLYYSTDDERNYNVLNYVDNETSVGCLLEIQNQSEGLSSNYVDTETKIVFTLLNEDGKLQSITDDDFSQLKNKILVGKEIIAFRDVEQIGENKFQISHLLRGRFNTDSEVSNHQIGERVVLLDNDFLTIDLPITMKNRKIFFKALSKGDSLMNVEPKIITPQAFSVCDFDIKNLEKRTMQNGDIVLSFSLRKGYKITDLSGFVLPSLSILTIYDKEGKSVRITRLEKRTSMYYTTSMQKNDFGKIINQEDITFDVRNVVDV